jgi:hypothetical protein
MLDVTRIREEEVIALVLLCLSSQRTMTHFNESETRRERTDNSGD